MSFEQHDVPSISLPKGGGAISGIGEKFSVAAATGTCSMSVPLPISPGRSGFQPDLVLSYDSGNGNGVFGLGWGVGIPSISRKTSKGVPKYNEEDVFLLAGSEDLVQIGEPGDVEVKNSVGDSISYSVTGYRPRIDSIFAKIEKWINLSTKESHWRTFSPDNVLSIYGLTSNSRIQDKGNVFSWLLCEVRERKGDGVLYEYEEDGVNRYIKSIFYGSNLSLLAGGKRPFEVKYPTGHRWLFEISFVYPDENRKDAYSSFRSGFKLRTTKLCSEVHMIHQFVRSKGVDEITDYAGPVKKVKFIYDENKKRSFISSMTTFGCKEVDGKIIEKAFPALEFSYTSDEINQEAEVEILEPDQAAYIPDGGQSASQRWVDLDGEGIAGVLTETENAWWYSRNRSVDSLKLGRPQLQNVIPNNRLYSGAQLSDIDGDGALELISHTGTQRGVYDRELNQTGWKPFRAFTKIPNVEWKNPNLKFVDLNGDGQADVLITESEVYRWYPSDGVEGFKAERRVSGELKPEVVFDDGTESIYLADMSGDGLVDIVRVRNGDVCYWPGMGYGRFAEKVEMSGAPNFDRVGQFNQKRIRLADIDGSGSTDILYLHHDRVTCYYNEAGNSWSEAIEISSLPSISNLQQVSVSDILGAGVPCLVWRSYLPSDRQSPLKYIKLLNTKPHLLHKLENNLGAFTEIKYSTSTRYYIEDSMEGRTWITKVPFPVQVVDTVSVYDLVSQLKFSTRYRYHHGYYDGVEREFRGFALVEQIDGEDHIVEGKPEAENLDNRFLTSPVLTKTWFHTGAFLERDTISNFFKSSDDGLSGYFRFEEGDPDKYLLEDNLMPEGLNFEEARDACRSLKGRELRKEVYAMDNSEAKGVPYTVSELNYSVRRLHDGKGLTKSIFSVFPRETISLHLEREKSNPRVQHTIVTKVDDYGNVLEEYSIAYGRAEEHQGLTEISGIGSGEKLVSQKKSWATKSTGNGTTPIGADSFSYSGSYLSGDYRTPVIWQNKVTELDVGNRYNLITSNELSELDVLKVVEHTKQIFKRESDLSKDADEGVIGSMAIPSFKKRLVYQKGKCEIHKKCNSKYFLEGKYEADVEVDDPSTVDWWSCSSTQIYAGTEAQFYQPSKYIDAFGNITEVKLDAYSLHPVSIENALNEIIKGEYNYRVGKPEKTTDLNNVTTEVTYDLFGELYASVTYQGDRPAGKTLESDFEEHIVNDFLDDPTKKARNLLKWGEKRFIRLHGSQTGYGRWKPSVVIVLEEEEFNQSDPDARVRISFAYGDAFGREVQTIQQSGRAAKEEQWLVSGKSIFNNRGKEVKKFEPFFKNNHHYIEEPGHGHSSTIIYDPLGRKVAQIHPNGTWEKVVFDTWSQAEWDVNDTCAKKIAEDDDMKIYLTPKALTEYTGPSWTEKLKIEVDLQGKEIKMSAPDVVRAKIQSHLETPSFSYLDGLGRVCVTVSQLIKDKLAAKRPTRTVLDIEGRTLATFDALNVEDGEDSIPVMEYEYCIRAGEEQDEDETDTSLIYQKGRESGERWFLYDVMDDIIAKWDAKETAFEFTYDQLKRPLLSKILEKGDDEEWLTYEKREYGKIGGEANLISRLIHLYDSSGVTVFHKYDMLGNEVYLRKRLASNYQGVTNWEAEIEHDDIRLEPEEFFNLEKHLKYDALSRLQSKKSGKEPEVTYQYSIGGYEDKVKVDGSEILTSIIKNEKGQTERTHYGNGCVEVKKYDKESYRLMEYTLSKRDQDSDVVLKDLRYSYDPAGNPLLIVDHAIKTRVHAGVEVRPENSYTYDALYRLKKATGREHLAGMMGESSPYGFDESCYVHSNDEAQISCYEESYEYDLGDNITKQKHTTVGVNIWTRHFDYLKNSNRLDRSGIGEDETLWKKYGYDVHGNMDGLTDLTSLKWNSFDQLQSSQRDGLITYYVYDLTGNRVRKVTQKTGGEKIVRQNIYSSGYEQVLRYKTNGELNKDKSSVRSKISVADDASYTNQRFLSGDVLRSYSMRDHLGSVTMELDNNGLIINCEEYSPFGSSTFRSVIEASQKAPRRHRFNGKERDEESGLYYYGARYYAPWLCRWTACDPIGVNGGMNIYCYVNNNPIYYIDPEGEEPFVAMSEWQNKNYDDKNYHGSVSTNSEAVAHFKSRKGGYLSASPELIKSIKNSIPYKVMKNKTKQDIMKNVQKMGDDVLQEGFKMPVREAGRTSYENYFDWVVGSVGFKIEEYKLDHKFSKHSRGGHDLIYLHYEGVRKLSFVDEFKFEQDPGRPKTTFFTDVLPSWIVGEGVPYKIRGQFTDTIKGSFLIKSKKSAPTKGLKGIYKFQN